MEQSHHLHCACHWLENWDSAVNEAKLWKCHKARFCSQFEPDLQFTVWTWTLDRYSESARLDQIKQLDVRPILLEAYFRQHGSCSWEIFTLIEVPYHITMLKANAASPVFTSCSRSYSSHIIYHTMFVFCPKRLKDKQMNQMTRTFSQVECCTSESGSESCWVAW